MNDQQFLERAHANPHDDAPEFLEAAASTQERQQLLEELKQFDADLNAGLVSVSAPENLKQSLLSIPEHAESAPEEKVEEAANDSFWRRNMQYAAAVLVAVGVLAFVIPGQQTPLETLVFNHIYSEMSFLDDDTPVPLTAVNLVMNNRIGKEFMASEAMDNLQINVTEDCWVDIENGIQGVHMVVKGSVGPVTVMMIPSTPVASEMAISDDRFEGTISPTPGGNLVVIGEKQETISMYSTMLAANINW